MRCDLFALVDETPASLGNGVLYYEVSIKGEATAEGRSPQLGVLDGSLLLNLPLLCCPGVGIQE